MAILSTLAELKEYFTLWHTQNFNTLHNALDNKYAPLSHIDVKSSSTINGHVKTINHLSASEYATDEALSAYQGYILGSRLDNIEGPLLKVGVLRGIDDTTWQEISNDDGLLDRCVNDGRLSWGNTKIHIDLFNTDIPHRLIIQVLDRDLNPQIGRKLYIKMNGVWIPRVTGNAGVANIKINYANNGANGPRANLHDIINWADVWKMIDIYAMGKKSDVHNSISKKMLINFGQNLWNEAITNSDYELYSYAQQAETFDPNNHGANENYTIAAINVNGQTIGYKIKAHTNVNGQYKNYYFRYPRDNYDNIYGHPSINFSGE